jgi:tetratricopeptide (TPR) repeat protein
MHLEAINDFNNYNPSIIISNKPASDLNGWFKNEVLYFNEKIRANNTESLNFLNRSVFNYLIKDYSPALNDINRAIELDPNNILAYFTRANCQLKMIDEIRQIAESSAPLTIPIGNDPKTAPTSVTQVTTPDYSKVLADYQKCIELDPHFAFAYYNRAYVECEMKQYQNAIDDLNKAIAIEKDFAEAYFNRGLTRIYLDDNTGGAIDLSKAGELGIQDSYNVIKRYCN